MLNNSSNSIPSEVRALREIAQPGTSSEHIVQAFDHWFCTDKRRRTSRTFIKLQRCEETLEDYLERARTSGSSLAPLDIVEIMIQILSGVCHCHDRKVGHRDLKESNSKSDLKHLQLALFLRETCSCHPSHHRPGRWLITDFGFSAINLDSDAFVVSYQGRGTPTYRAPELIRGRLDDGAVKFCRRSDSWSIGCILFKVATTNARSPFRSDWDVARFDLEPSMTAPKLNATDNANLGLSTECSERRRPVPLWEQFNDILELCFTREPEQRATAFQLKDRFESIWRTLPENGSQADSPRSQLARTTLHG
jgi:serine/threonine protein kinase